ncbi:MAG: hypothetical protein Q7S31_00395 [bacterium]|nr:hypothetical protein [bacterium]
MNLPVAIVAIVSLILISVFSNHNSGNQNSHISPSAITSSPSPSTNPSVDPQVLTDTVKQYYVNISSKRIDQAWGLLSKNFQNSAKNYDSFAKGYTTTRSVLVQDTRIQDLPNYIVFIKLQASDTIYDQVQTKDYSGTWKLIKEDGSWKLDSADIVLLNVSPSSRALSVATFVYAYDSPTEIEDWRNKHGIKKSNSTQEIHEQALWMDQHLDVLALNEAKIEEFKAQQLRAASQPQQIYDNSSDENIQPPLTNSYAANTPNPVNILPKSGSSISYSQYGNTLYGSDGSSYSKYGNTIYGSDGSSYSRYGNTTYGNDGSTYSQYGNTIYGNDGTSYSQYGNTLYGSDGSSATQYGNTIYTQPGY